MSKRVQFFDILKSIAIVLVVFCHCSGFQGTIFENIFMTICFVGVPIFFLVNGALLLNKSMDLKKHLKKTLSVYIVAVVWRLIYLLIGIIQTQTFDVFFENTQETLSYLFLWTDSSLANPAHMWFMKHLLAIYIIFPIIHTCLNGEKNNKKSVYFLLITLFVAFIACVEANHVVFILEKYTSLNIHVNITEINSFMPYSKGQSIFYFVLGGVLWNYLKDGEWKKRFKIDNKLRILAIVVFVISWVLMMLTKFLYDGTWNWNGMLYADGYSRIPTLLATLSLFAMFVDIEMKAKLTRKVFEKVSNATLGVFYLHWCLLPIVETMFSESGVHINWIKTAIVVIISCVISYILSFVPGLRKLVQ